MKPNPRHPDQDSDRELQRFAQALTAATKLLQKALLRLEGKGGLFRAGRRGLPGRVRPWVQLRVHWGPDNIRTINIGKPTTSPGDAPRT